MEFKDHFTESAEEYGKFRPGYPLQLFAFLESLCPGRSVAWDCATGSGQAALGLASRFGTVVATDASRQQLRNSRQAANIAYIAALAEQCPLRNRCVDLVTVAQAVHWLDPDLFYGEVRRVLRPGGVIAVWIYSLLRIEPIIDAMIDDFYGGTVGDYWPPERKLVEEGLDSLDFPFPQTPAPQFRMEARWSLDHLVGYLGTWSSVKGFRRDRGFDPLGLLVPGLSRAWGRPGDTKRIIWPIRIRVGSV